jgi:hypothetical protein
LGESYQYGSIQNQVYRQEKRMVAMANHFGRAAKELEYFVSQHKEGIRSVLENQISAARCPSKLQARYHPFATWEIVSKSEVGQPHEEVVLDLFFNTGFDGGNCKQLIIRRYGAGGDFPHAREVQKQKYILLQDGKNPVDALQKALTDLPLD